MKRKPNLLLIALALLLMVTAAGSARAAKLQLVATPSWEFYPGALDQGVDMGYAVAGAGRVNSDLYDDILVGAPKGANKYGWVGLFTGSSSGPGTTPAWEAIGERQGDMFGSALDGAGDVDNNGFADIIVGAYKYQGTDSLEEQEGAVYVYHSTAEGISLAPGWPVEGNQVMSYLGTAVSGGGFINDDEYADAVVGAPGYDYEDINDAGAFYVYYGSANGLIPDADPWHIGPQGGAGFGSEVSFAGDVNGDGFDDVLVGAPNYDRVDGAYTFSYAGAVYLYLGGEEKLDYLPVWSYYGFRGGDNVGTSIAHAGDLNDDGCDDIAIGAPGFNYDVYDNSGRVYVFYGCQPTSSGLNDLPDWETSLRQAGASFGIAVSGGGDTDHDGSDELLVGAHLFDDEQANEGAVYAFFGSPDGLALQPGWQVDGDKNDTYFGFAVDGAGDTNNDGFTDVLIGAPEFKINTISKGAAFLYFGSQQAIINYYHTHLPFIRK